MKSVLSDRIIVTTLLWLKPGGSEALARFRDRAAPLWTKYDLRIERVLVGTGKGQLVGTNDHDVPDVIQLFSLPSREAFQSYVADPEVRRISAERDAGIARSVAMVGDTLDVSALRPESDSDTSGRQYVLALVRFLEGGAEAMVEFNTRARPLFARHGMHIEAMSNVKSTLTPVGDPLPDFAPERVVLFFLDSATALKAYASDPEYRELAPIRDKGLRSYDFFLAKAAPLPVAARSDEAARQPR